MIVAKVRETRYNGQTNPVQMKNVYPEQIWNE